LLRGTALRSLHFHFVARCTLTCTRRFGTPYRPYLYGSRSLNMRPKQCTETSVTNRHCATTQKSEDLNYSAVEVWNLV
jgi:hypothetical protein